MSNIIINKTTSGKKMSKKIDISESKNGVGGSKLNRSETVTVRLDPKLNYLCELAARKHRRTRSSFIEWAVEKSLGTVILGEDYCGEEVSLQNAANTLWDTDESDRLANLALNQPDLLIHEEQVLWKVISDCEYFWKGTRNTGRIRNYADADKLDRKKLGENWELLKKIAAGKEGKDKLPKCQSEATYDDIPF